MHSMMFAQSQPHLMHFLKLTGLPIFLDFYFSSNIIPHFFLVTVSHVVQTTAASSRFECGFHDGCSKSTSFDAFPEFAGLLSFLVFVSNSDINQHFVVWVTVSHIVQKTSASNRFECGFHYVCFKSTSFDAIPHICKSFDFPIFCFNSNINLHHFSSYCKPHRSTNSRFKRFRVCIPWCLLQVKSFVYFLKLSTGPLIFLIFGFDSNINPFLVF